MIQVSERVSVLTDQQYNMLGDYGKLKWYFIFVLDGKVDAVTFGTGTGGTLAGKTPLNLRYTVYNSAIS